MRNHSALWTRVASRAGGPALTAGTVTLVVLGLLSLTGVLGRLPPWIPSPALQTLWAAALALAAFGAVTNVVKHAGRAQVVVDLAYQRDRLEVEVADDGHGAAAAPSDGARLGLVGMRERVEMLHGTFVAGPRDGGGFRVRATLPVTGGIG